MNYADIVKVTDPNAATGGYKNVVIFAPRTEFTSIKTPVAPYVVLGDALTIKTAHTFVSPKGFVSWACKTHSVTITGATVGEDGAKEMDWTSTFVLLGDSASTDEQLRRMLNDDIIMLVKEADCLNSDKYVQLGDECVSPIFTVAFDGKTTAEGKKEYTVNAQCKKKFFYEAAVTYAVVEEEG